MNKYMVLLAENTVVKNIVIACLMYYWYGTAFDNVVFTIASKITPGFDSRCSNGINVVRRG